MEIGQLNAMGQSSPISATRMENRFEMANYLRPDVYMLIISHRYAFNPNKRAPENVPIFLIKEIFEYIYSMTKYRKEYYGNSVVASKSVIRVLSLQDNEITFLSEGNSDLLIT